MELGNQPYYPKGNGYYFPLDEAVWMDLSFSSGRTGKWFDNTLKEDIPIIFYATPNLSIITIPTDAILIYDTDKSSSNYKM
jgi:hypothetical protein